jgi:hypothetical protein
MKKALLMAALVAFVASSSFAATTAAKKMELGVGAGIAVPMGDFGDAYGIGFGGGLSARFLVAPTISVGGALSYNTFGSDVDNGPSASAIEILASAKFMMGKGSTKPYILAGLGFCNFGVGDYTMHVPGYGDVAVEGGSTTDLEIQPGFGVQFGGKTKFFVEGKYSMVMTEGDSTSFLPITFGLLF